MFGYVRPLKPELLVREFSRYKSIYCGICKQIGHDFGQLPRITLGYDLTMLAVLLLSLSAKQPPDELAGCIINPLARPRRTGHRTLRSIDCPFSLAQSRRRCPGRKVMARPHNPGHPAPEPAQGSQTLSRIRPHHV
jgi:hypothetical protein